MPSATSGDLVDLQRPPLVAMTSSIMSSMVRVGAQPVMLRDQAQVRVAAADLLEALAVGLLVGDQLDPDVEPVRSMTRWASSMIEISRGEPMLNAWPTASSESAEQEDRVDDVGDVGEAAGLGCRRRRRSGPRRSAPGRRSAAGPCRRRPSGAARRC